jgi:hypothetical protein
VAGELVGQVPPVGLQLLFTWEMGGFGGVFDRKIGVFEAILGVFEVKNGVFEVFLIENGCF